MPFRNPRSLGFSLATSEIMTKFLRTCSCQVAVLGCMAERLKTKLLEADKLVDVVCGPDAYRDLPRLLGQVDQGQTGVNVMLSLDETYADISPVR